MPDPTPPSPRDPRTDPRIDARIDPQPADRAPAAPRSDAAKSTNETIKETLESLVIAFVLAFVFRAYVVEAFVIPTGSMAPTLLGAHLDVTCPQCGYRFSVDPSGLALGQGHFTQVLHQNESIVCPMCHYAIMLQKDTGVSAGDRILVHKYIYSISEPRRWDVVVFKAPHEPGVNYIKRLAGLPGEDLFIIEGNLYTKPAGGPESQWRIARKTARWDGERVQRVAWQPVYHSTYVPRDWRTARDPAAVPFDQRTRDPEHKWETPWDAPGDPAWRLEARPTYVHDGAQPGVVRFNFDQALPATGNWYPYDQVHRPPAPLEPLEDVRLAAAFQPAGPGLSVRLQTSARWDTDQPDAKPVKLTGRIDAGGRATLEVEGRGTPLDAVEVGPFVPGQTRAVELWYVDQELSLWVDGRRVLRQSFELSMDTLQRRPALGPRDFPKVEIEVAGTTVAVHRVEVDRDLYYSSPTYDNFPHGPACLGVLVKEANRPARGAPLHLERDEFFCLGDNSPMSSDGRYWPRVDPWVELRFLQDHQQRIGIVPRELMMGRAFFVYFPAPYRWNPQSLAVFPNFGDMRFIH